MSNTYYPGALSPTLGPGMIATHIVFFDDFITGGAVLDAELASESDPAGGKFSQVADAAEWLVTIGNDTTPATTFTDETITIADAAGGILSIASDADDNDYIQIQLNGECWQLAEDRPVMFECRFSVDDADTVDLFVGLGITDADINDGLTDFIGFGDSADTGDLWCGNGKDATATDEPFDDITNGTRTDTGTDLADGSATTEFVTVRFIADPTSIKYYVGATDAALSLVATHTTDIPDNELLSPAIAIRNASAAASTIHVDYIFVSQRR